MAHNQNMIHSTFEERVDNESKAIVTLADIYLDNSSFIKPAEKVVDVDTAITPVVKKKR